MKPFLALLFIALCRCAIVTSLVTRYPLTRAQRDTRLNASIGFTEIRQRIAKIVANITKYSEKVQNGISQMDVHKHNLNEESSEALVKQKLIADQRRSLQQQLLALANDVTATKQQLDDINVRISKEAEDVRNAEDDLNEKREEKPKWYCVWKCRKKWKKVQQERVEDAEAVLRAAQQRYGNAIKTKGETKAKLKILNEQLINMQSSLNTISQERKDQSDEDLGIEWEAINGSLKVISNYLNNGGFVNDLAGWGIDIKGFDVQSVKTLGIDVDENTARLLKMKPIENPTVPSLSGVKPLFSDQLPNGRPPILPTRTPKTKFWWPKNDVWPPVVSGR